MMRNLKKMCDRARTKAASAHCALLAKLRCTRGQGTTEYAILVGVLVSEE